MSALRRLLSSTRGRLVLIQVAALALTVAVTDAAVVEVYVLPVPAQVDRSLFDQWTAAQTSLVERDGSVVAIDFPDEGVAPGVTIPVEVVASGQVIAQTSDPAVPRSQVPELVDRVVGADLAGPIDAPDGSGGRLRVYADDADVGADQLKVVILASRPMGPVDASIHLAELAMVLGSLLVLLLGTLLARRLADSALRPVRRITHLARQVNQNDLSPRVEVESPADELGELVDTFNAMLGRLESGFTSLRQFTANASHELRAPLAATRTQVEVALSRPEIRGVARQVLLDIGANVEHLARITDQLLTLARADARSLTVNPAPIDVADTLLEMAARWSTQGQERTVEVVADAPDTGRMLADPDLTRRILDNLIENAIRHSPRGGRVSLVAALEDGWWHLSVTDQGHGIGEEHRAHIFERFHRVDASRTRSSGGAGLGLAISSTLAALQGGQLELVESRPGRTVFRLRQPQAST